MNLNNITKTIQRIVGARADGIYGQETARKILAILQPQTDAPSEPEQPATGKKFRIAIDVGHSQTEEGATHALDGIGECAWNFELAYAIQHELEKLGHVVGVFNRYPHNSISKGAAEINDWGADFALSLHCNAFNGSASGTETLYCKGSTKGKIAAEFVQAEMVEHLGLPNRGIKEKIKGEDGHAFLSKVKAPAILLEPFFCDNAADCQRVKDKGERPALAKAIVRGINSYLLDN